VWTRACDCLPHHVPCRPISPVILGWGYLHPSFIINWRVALLTCGVGMYSRVHTPRGHPSQRFARRRCRQTEPGVCAGARSGERGVQLGSGGVLRECVQALHCQLQGLVDGHLNRAALLSASVTHPLCCNYKHRRRRHVRVRGGCVGKVQHTSSSAVMARGVIKALVGSERWSPPPALSLSLPFSPLSLQIQVCGCLTRSQTSAESGRAGGVTDPGRASG
jgi:hypothetical protein